ALEEIGVLDRWHGPEGVQASGARIRRRLCDAPLPERQLATKEPPMFGIVFRIEGQPGKYQELVEFLKWDGEICRDREPGTLRFEFYRDPNDDNALFVYEAYRDQDAFEAHKKNAPFQRWSSGLRDELGTNFTVLFRGDAVWSPVG